jgi:hypothetical protein
LSKVEQAKVIALLHSELSSNLRVVNDLMKNANSLSGAAFNVANVLRDKRFPIASGLFPVSNSDPDAEEDPDLYNKRFNWLVQSGLLNDAIIFDKHQKQMESIVRTIDRTESTILSLGDRNGIRYIIHNEVYKANLPILRKVEIADTQNLAQLYAKTEQVRQEYFRVADSVAEYLFAVRAFCKRRSPDQAELGAALTSERLTVRLLKASMQSLSSLVKETDDLSKKMESKK